MLDIEKLENIILKKYHHSYLCCLFAWKNIIGPKRYSISFYYELLSYMERKYPEIQYTLFIKMIEKTDDGIEVLEDLFNSNKLNKNLKGLNKIEVSFLLDYVLPMIIPID